MADINWLGATWQGVGYVALPKAGGGEASFHDLSGDTLSDASQLQEGIKGHLADGTQVTGTGSGGGSSSAWTKVAETTYTVSTTNTTAQTVATWATGHSEIWTSSKLVYVRIRDTAGKRDGYHYGTDQFFFNPIPVNGTSGASTTVSGRVYTRYSNGVFTTAATSGTTGYGIYADQIYNDGRIRIRSRYSSSSSLTINGTYKVEVYLLDPAGGVLPFA